MKKQKESIVIFEDWFRYARCLNDTEFRTFMNTILQYYKEPFTPDFTGLMLEVWNDIIDDLQSNVQKKQAKRNTMLSNSRTNPKLNTVPDIGPDTRSNIVLNTAPETTGMVDGRWDMVDGGLKIVDSRSGYDDRGNYVIEDTMIRVDEDGFPIPPISQSKLELENKKLVKFDKVFGDA
jgi:hypothetical protein